MERIINLDIELLPEGVYLGTSDDVQGLVVQAKTIQEVVEIARDMSRILLEWHQGTPVAEPEVIERIRIPVPIAAE